MGAPEHLKHCFSVLRHAVAPRRALSVSQWADDHRILSGKQSSERGRWRTARNPILREIMDCFSMHSRVRDLVVMKSSQVGVTEAVVNALGYIMEHAPAPVMVMMPTIESRDSWKVQKLNPLLQETPIIRDLLGGIRSRDAANRQDLIDFPGGVLFLAGGNSANSYAQKSVKTIILDDLDRFPEEIGEEGDIITLAEGRTKAFPRALRCYISTPTLKGGLIHRQWERSDQRRYHVPCPHCGEFQPLEWGGPNTDHGLKWSVVQGQEGGQDEIVSVRYVCRGCGGEIQEHDKPRMLAQGRWIARYPERARRGYHISALYAPIGLGPSWRDLVAGWLAAQENTATLRAFINTNLGEPWEERGEAVDPLSILARLEPYPADMPRRVRSVGIDVQKDRIEMLVVEFGQGEECWAIDHVIVAGDTAGRDPWDELAEQIEDIAPDCGGIDSGYNADQVYEFARRRPWLYVCKGVEGRGMTLVEDDEARRRRLRKKRKKGFSPFLVSDEAAKALLTQRLKLEPPPPGQGRPGYLHFPQGEAAFDDEFFAQLTSNRLVEKTVKGKLVREWQQTRVRNEAFDCWKYALAGFRLSKIDPAAFMARRESEKAGASDLVKAVAKPVATSADARAQQRRFTRTW
jgi:phage terminase large subunit GpA-like protein